MNRKQFIESQGATCKNWNWSWSFVNEEKRFVIFGAWDVHTEGNTTLILSDNWVLDNNGHKSKSYPQSREHIRLIQEENYELKVFPMVYSNKLKKANGEGPAKIGEFTPKLTTKALKRIGNGWYASDNILGETIPEEISDPQLYAEGVSKTITVNTFERSKKARNECLRIHGFKCAVCSFDFEEMYGVLGKEYIHVHHIIPLAQIKKEYVLNPKTDLVPICPNCHAMVHNASPVLTIEELKSILRKST